MLHIDNDFRYVSPNRSPDQHTSIEEISVTAIVLNWKRPGNLDRIVRYLDRKGYISEIILWNNNPEPLLTEFGSPKVRVVNSPDNLKDLAKYRAASMATNDHCFYQDDDWYTGEYIDAMYCAFCLRPDTLHTATSASIWLENWAWSCYSDSLNLHAEIGWIGCGAFFPKQMAIDYLAVLDHHFEPAQRLISDYGFALTRNQPVVQMQVILRKLDQSAAYSHQEQFQEDLHSFGEQVHRLLPRFGSDLVEQPVCVMRHAASDALLFTSFLPFDYDYQADKFDPAQKRFGTDRIARIAANQRSRFLENPYNQALGPRSDKHWIADIRPGDIWGIVVLFPAVVSFRVTDLAGAPKWRVTGLQRNDIFTSNELSRQKFGLDSIIALESTNATSTTVSIKITVEAHN